jgi:hypothetical protein
MLIIEASRDTIASVFAQVLAILGKEVLMKPRQALPAVQATRADPVRVLWCGDGDRKNAHSIRVLHSHCDSPSHRGDALIV